MLYLLQEILTLSISDELTFPEFQFLKSSNMTNFCKTEGMKNEGKKKIRKELQHDSIIYPPKMVV